MAEREERPFPTYPRTPPTPRSPRPPRSPLLPRMAILVLLVVIGYLGLLVLLRLNERRLIYFPGPQRTLLSPPAQLDLPVQQVEIPTDDGLTLMSWLIRAGSDSTGIWLLICHGNAGNLSEFDR